MSELPREGITVRAHVDVMFARMEEKVALVREALKGDRQLRRAEREVLSRELAGVVGAAEGIRWWLKTGAPR